MIAGAYTVNSRMNQEAECRLQYTMLFSSVVMFSIHYVGGADYIAIARTVCV